jgi:steroid delta-isomerase-like uncharacterized protein
MRALVYALPDVPVARPGGVGVGATENAAVVRRLVDEAVNAAFRRFHSVFPDLHVVIEDVVAEGDRVAARWTATGTHSGEFAGLPATGRAVRWGGIDIYRLVGGKVAEWWRNDDFIWLLKQLGKLLVD